MMNQPTSNKKKNTQDLHRITYMSNLQEGMHPGIKPLYQQKPDGEEHPPKKKKVAPRQHKRTARCI